MITTKSELVNNLINSIELDGVLLRDAKLEASKLAEQETNADIKEDLEYIAKLKRKGSFVVYCKSLAFKLRREEETAKVSSNETTQEATQEATSAPEAKPQSQTPAKPVKPYYTLLVREHGQWGVAFGDYDKEVVMDEKRDEYGDHLAMNLRIIKTGDTQAHIDAKIRGLNKC